MKTKITTLVLIAGLTMPSIVLAQPEFIKEYKCPMEGCNITCITKNKGTLQVDGARKITMSIYQSGTTVYEAEIGLGEKETIITGESDVCKIEHHN